MNAETAITISNSYREAKSQFEMSKPAIEQRQLENIVMQRFSALTNGDSVFFEGFEILPHKIVINITNQHDDGGTYIVDLETFLKGDVDAVNEHETSISKGISLKESLIRIIHTRDFIKMRDAIKALNESPLECNPKIPEWYSNARSEVERLNQEISTMKQSRKVAFCWN